MTQKALIARAGRGLLDLVALLLRGVGLMFAAIGSLVLFAWKNSEEASREEDGLTDAELQMRDLDPNFKNGGFYNYDRY